MFSIIEGKKLNFGYLELGFFRYDLLVIISVYSFHNVFGSVDLFDKLSYIYNF